MNGETPREVIVQYIGNGQELFEGRVNSYQELLGGYAIVKASAEQIRQLQEDNRVLYVEYPRSVYYEELGEADREEESTLELLTGHEHESALESRTGQESGNLFIQQVSNLEFNCPETESTLQGEGVLMAYLDSGIDYRHPEFLDENGKTRILEILDLSGGPETVYSREQINEALLLPRQEGNKIVPETDGSGHGTHVAGIGSGNSGVAPGSEILMIRLGRGVRQYSRTSELMLGMDHCIRLAAQRNQPVVINISYGNNYGAHNGTAMMEQYLDQVLNYAKAVIVAGSGNEGGGSSHFAGEVSADNPMNANFSVGEFQKGFGFSLYKDFKPDMSLRILPPGGEWIKPDLQTPRAEYRIPEGRLLVENRTPSPHTSYQEVYMELEPQQARNTEERYLRQGLWQIEIATTDPNPWPVDLWLPVSESLAAFTGFTNPSPETTLTIPSSARRAVTVGAYDTRTGQVAGFSGRGYTWNEQLVKPDLVAPGVGILSAAPGGGYTRRTGTSMATPFVSGAAALLMEAGILQGRDPFLYADKVKAYLIKGAKPITEYTQYPNRRAGWGALCIRESLKAIP